MTYYHKLFKFKINKMVIVFFFNLNPVAGHNFIALGFTLRDVSFFLFVEGSNFLAELVSKNLLLSPKKYT